MEDSGISRREFIKKAAGVGAACFCAPMLGGLSAVEKIVDSITGAAGYSIHEALHYTKLADGKVQCTLCPNNCTLANGARGLCHVRGNVGGKLVSMVYGYTARVRGDAMEKSPFFHFLPASQTVALGTVGCNLHCLYCQNWEFTQTDPERMDPPPQYLPPESLVAQAKKYKRPAICFTYSEPVVAIEYVLATARLAKQAGLRVIVKSGAYANPGPFKDICKAVSAINIDFKAYSSSFYQSVCGGTLNPILESIKTAHKHCPWLELTYMTVPGKNDSDSQFRDAVRWIKQNVGPNVPLHVSRFFPSYKLRNLEATSIDRLRALRKIAYSEGLNYVYLGNLQGDPAESTYCPKCGDKLVKRIGYNVNVIGIRNGRCCKCGIPIPGVWT